MEERVYKTMNRAGVANIVIGVVTLVVGLATGILLVNNGARLLAGKSKSLF